MLPPVELSRNTKIAAVVVACMLAGAVTAVAVAKLNSRSTSSATKQQSGLRTGVIAPRRGFGFAPADIGPRFFRTGSLSAAAKYLGLSPAELFARLGSGQTLAQIAESAGKSASGLIEAMTAAQKAELDAAVKDGRLTQAQADQLEAALKDRITALVNGQFGFGFRHDDDSDRSQPPAAL